MMNERQQEKATQKKEKKHNRTQHSEGIEKAVCTLKGNE